MNLSNYTDYAAFEYENNISDKDDYQLGDVVINDEQQEIGVIIQVHSRDEFRTDMFGNCCSEEIRLATQFDIDTHRPNLLNEGNLGQFKM